ncbi:MAG: hypothetical protein NT029_20570 [Armatimonadetes bacterium]|nr:hypothetical protein [Armatimonadota bacterium]
MARWSRRGQLLLLSTLLVCVCTGSLGQSRPDVIWQRPGFGDGPLAAVYSPDGTMLAVAGTRAVKLWRTSDGAYLRSLRANDWMASAIWSQSGAHVIGLSMSGTLLRWRASDGVLLKRVAAQQSTNWGPRSLALSPDGLSIVTCGQSDANACVWRASDFVLQRRIPLSSVSSVAWSAGGIIACGRTDKTIALADPSTGSLIRTLSGHTGAVNSVAFSPDGGRLVSASADMTARIWDVASGSALHTLASHTAAVYDAAFSPDGSRVATGANGADRTLRIWNAAAGTIAASVNTNGWTNPVAFSPDGLTVCSGWKLGCVAEYAALDCSLQRELSLHCRRVAAMARSHDGQTLAAATGDNAIHLWATADGAKRQALTAYGGVVQGALGFSADDTVLVAVDYYGGIHRFGAADGIETSVVYGDIVPNSAALSPDCSMAVMGAWDGALGLFDTTTGAKVWGSTAFTEPIHSLQFSPDGLSIAFRVDSGAIYVLSALTGAVTASTSRQASGALCFSPDSSLLAAGYGSNGVSIWNTGTGTVQSIALPGETGQTWPLSFTPDGAYMAVTGGDFWVEIVRIADGVTRALYSEESSFPAGAGCYSPDGKVLYYGTEDSSVIAMATPDTTANASVTVASATVPFNEAVTLTAALKSGGLPIVGQWLHFWVGNLWGSRWYAGSGLTDASGIASITVNAPEPPYWSIRVAFAGGGGYGYTTGSGNLWVTKGATTVYVIDRAGIISVAGSSVGSAVTDAGGQAVLSYVIATVAGVHAIGASFAGDSQYLPSSSSSTLSATVTNTKVYVVDRTAKIKSYVVLKAYLYTPANVTIAGKPMTVKLDGVALGSGVTNPSGYYQVGYTVAEGAGAGARVIRGEFVGDGGYNASANHGALTATQGDLYVWPYFRSGKRGTSHPLKAYVRSLPDYVIQPGKSITFKVNGSVIGSATAAADGWATVAWSIPVGEPTGAHTGAAEFAGDAWYGPLVTSATFNVAP